MHPIYYQAIYYKHEGCILHPCYTLRAKLRAGTEPSRMLKVSQLCHTVSDKINKLYNFSQLTATRLYITSVKAVYDIHAIYYEQ